MKDFFWYISEWMNLLDTMLKKICQIQKEYMLSGPNYIKFKNRPQFIIMIEIRIMVTFCGGNDERDTKEASGVKKYSISWFGSVCFVKIHGAVYLWCELTVCLLHLDKILLKKKTDGIHKANIFNMLAVIKKLNSPY